MNRYRLPASGALVFATLVAATGPAHAQLALTNLLEARVGGNPFQSQLPQNRNEIYDLLDLDCQLPSLRLGLRFETHRNGFETEDQPGYGEITQRYAEWNDDRLRVRVGNFHTIIGRGLIHRSFELTGVVLDDIGFGSRYSPSRDVDGVLAEAKLGPFAARGFSGSPNLGEFSPAAQKVSDDYQRHRGAIAGGQVTAGGWRGAALGLGYVRFSNEFSGQLEFGTVFTEVDPLRMLGVEKFQLPIYAEVARKNADWGEKWGIAVNEGDTAAVYAGANLIAGPLTFSAEWKDYRAFRLGPNDPPSLVREHGSYLLNRSTHFLLADREEGYQLEGAYTVPEWGTATVNLSRSDGVFVKPVRFEERYGELHVTPFGGVRGEATLFWQRGKDTFIGASIADRTIVGGAGTLNLPREFSASIDFEGLEATRVDFFGRPVADFKDRYATLGLARAGWGGITLAWERTDDPEAEDPDDQSATPFEVQPNTFVSVTLSADLGERHDVILFVGERRGGPACTAGTCYVVEPFDGVEMRLTSRF